ncbi:MAG: DUF748 domain-containing protein, partial [Pseudomonadota bacterium]|nr:DUF748 domain-containing protein [Pseudomonadota bacterium]
MVWLRRLGWGVGAMALALLALWLAVPALIKWQLPPRATAALGRTVTLGNAHFEPWTLDLRLDDLGVAGRVAGAPPLLQLRELHTRLSLASLWHLAPVIQALELDGLQLRLARLDEGHYDVDDLIARFLPASQAKPTEASGHFALYNVQVRDAQVRFEDRPVQRVQVVEGLHLALPFISNLPAEVEVKVEPHLAFRLNGTAFDSGAQATPFAQTRNGELTFQVRDLDIAPYLGYLPAHLPVRVTQGEVSADVRVSFSLPPKGAPNVVVKGSASARRIALTDDTGAPLLAWELLQLGFKDVQPFSRRLAFSSVRVDGLQLHLLRDPRGRVNLLALASEPATPVAARAASAGAAAPPWKMSLDALSLADARIFWSDAAVTPSAALQLDGVAIDATGVTWPMVKPVPLRLRGVLRAQAAKSPALGEVIAEGPVTAHDAKLAVTLSRVSLGGFSPYFAQVLVPTLEGQLDARTRLDWSDAAPAPRLELQLEQLSLDALKIRDPAARPGLAAFALKRLTLADARLDGIGRRVSLGSVKLDTPSLDLVRDAAGHLNLQGWLRGAVPEPTPASPAPASPTSSSMAGAPVAPLWNVQLADLQVEAGQLRYTDAMGGAKGVDPVRLDVDHLVLSAQGLDWRGDRASAPVALAVSAKVGTATPDRRDLLGSISYKGKVGMQPLLAEGVLKAERVPLGALARYFADQLDLRLLRAEASCSGSLGLHQLADGTSLNATGDVVLGDVHLATLPAAGASAGDELLSWQALALKGVTVATRPKARPTVDIGDAELTDFYSRLVITEQGHFNFRDVATRPGEVQGVGATASGASSAAPATPAASTPFPVDLRIGGVRLTNGRIDFSDHFIRPNYSAALTQLNGQIGAFGTATRDLATLALRGHAEGTADLDISGKVNPLARPLALELRAKATDLELAPLSPYAGKYVGYAIERGKLSMDVNYVIDPDGRLQASNKVVLNQLTFGDKIESKDALKLPVLLAVALLKDRNGVIDINLPVSGSLNDPQFSVGSLIFKVIVNLLTKALTSPFALLGGASDGAEDLSQVEFRPGTADITPPGLVALDKVAQALNERPALKMTVTGTADSVAE